MNRIREQKEHDKVMDILKDPFVSFHTLENKVTGDDQDWLYTEEPHAGRRKEILDRHPEIKSLMGPDPFIVLPSSITVLLQIILCWVVKDVSWLTLFFMAYCLGGTFNHSLGSALHEMGHNLAFGHGKRSWMNRVLSLLVNLPMGVPIAISYKKYHSDHHRYLGEERQDVDIPTRLESWLFKRPVTKMVWLISHPLIYSVRPFCKSPKPVLGWEVVNLVTQVLFDLVIFRLLGIKAVVYMILGTVLGLGLHPLTGHFISEHYLFTEGQATHSYYGPLNFILYNAGYHTEHHDFPYVPYNKLPEVKRLAPEFYDTLPCHTSLIRVLWDFIFDVNMGPHARGVAYKTGGSHTKTS